MSDMVYAPHKFGDEKPWPICKHCGMYSTDPRCGKRPLGEVEEIERALKLLHLLETADEWVPKDRGYTADEIGEMLGVGPSRSDQIVVAYDTAERVVACINHGGSLITGDTDFCEVMEGELPPYWSEGPEECAPQQFRLVPEIGDTE